MAKRPATAKALFKELEGHIAASKATLTVSFNGSTVPLYLPSAGIVTGEDYGAMMLDGKPYLLELDRKGTGKSVKVLTSPDAATVAKISKALLPEPEPPQEVKQAQEALGSLPKLPKGYRYSVDAKGNVTVVEDGDTTHGRKRGGGEGTGIKTTGVDIGNHRATGNGEGAAGKRPNPMPKLEAGMRLVRNKDGYEYTVTGLDARLKKVYLEPIGEGDKGLAAGYPAPVFWRNWQVAE